MLVVTFVATGFCAFALSRNVGGNHAYVKVTGDEGANRTASLVSVHVVFALRALSTTATAPPAFSMPCVCGFQIAPFGFCGIEVV